MIWFHFALLSAAAVLRSTYAQSTAALSHRLKWQNNDGSMEIILTCSMPSLPDKYDAHETCTIYFSNSSLASNPVQVHESDLQGQNQKAVCEHTVSVRANGVDQQQSFSAYCRRRVRKRWTRQRLVGLKKVTKIDWENPESPHVQVNPFQLYLRRASVSTVQTGPQNTVELTQGSSALLECKVANLQNWDDHACQWTFSPGPAVVLPMNAQEQTIKFGNRAIVTFSQEQSSCQLKLYYVMPNMEGHWSCTPGPGKDGWILPSQPVLIKVHGDTCQQDNDCPIHDVCAKTVPSNQFRDCVNVCNTHEGHSVCGNVQNGVCIPSSSNPKSPSCVCKQGFVIADHKGTSSTVNELLCVPACHDSNQCGPEDICEPHSSMPNAKVCKPWCLLSPCGAGALCSVATETPSSTKLRTCACQNGLFPLNSVTGAEAGCGPPVFKSFFMAVNGSYAEGCAIHNENILSQDCKVTVEEGSELSIWFGAPGAFPHATFEISLVADIDGGTNILPMDTSITTKDHAERDNKGDPDGIEIMLHNILAEVYNQRTIVCKMKQRGLPGDRAIRLTLTVATPEPAVTEIPLVPSLPTSAPDQGIFGKNSLFKILLASAIGGSLLAIIIVVFGFLMSKKNNNTRPNVKPQGEVISKENGERRAGSVAVNLNSSQAVATIYPMKEQLETAADEHIYENYEIFPAEGKYNKSAVFNQLYDSSLYQKGQVATNSEKEDAYKIGQGLIVKCPGAKSK